jgi:hypothetical protein
MSVLASLTWSTSPDNDVTLSNTKLDVLTESAVALA